MNTVNLIGRISKDIELKTSQTGCYCKFTVAVSRDKEKSDFINCVVFNKTAELLARSCSKGTQIGITGSIQTGSYTNSEGRKVYTTEVLVSRLSFIEAKQQSAPPQQPTYGYSQFDIKDQDLPF